MSKAIGLLAVVLVLYIAAAAGLFWVQRQILFRPDPAEWAPEALGLSGVEVRRIEAEDGARLVTWLLRRDGRRLFLYLHGTGGSLAYRVERIRQLAALGSVLAIDYRGFGGSTGSPSEVGLGHDAEAAYRFAIATGFAPADIVILGESLGSGLALRLAAHRPVGGVVLAAAYTSIEAIAAERYWMFPVRWFLRDPFDVAGDVARIPAPILVLHGTEDGLIPLRFAEALVAGAGSAVSFVPVAGGQHLVLDHPAAMLALERWLDRLPAASRPASTAEP